jgi:hypothetical protein
MTLEYKGKIAFCFLIVQNVKNMDLWRKFFRSYEDYFNIYVHISGNRYDEKNYWYPELWNNRVEVYGHKHTATKWGTASLVKAEGIVYETALENPENKYFCLLSESDIPMLSFPRIYNLMNRTLGDKKSFLTFDSSRGFDSAMFKDCFPTEYIPVNDRSKVYDRRYWTMWNIHQWKVLNRRDAYEFVEMCKDKKYFDAYENCFVYNPEALAPDEYMYSNWITLHYGSKGFKKRFINHQTTWVDFDATAIHALEYKKVPKKLVRDICDNSSIFGRKFTKNKSLLKRFPLCKFGRKGRKSRRCLK